MTSLKVGGEWAVRANISKKVWRRPINLEKDSFLLQEQSSYLDTEAKRAQTDLIYPISMYCIQEVVYGVENLLQSNTDLGIW